MFAAEETAKEISQIEESGKRGFVLVMEDRREWEPVLEALRPAIPKGKACLEIQVGRRTVNQSTFFAPAFYQRVGERLCPIEWDELGQTEPRSTLAVGLEKWGRSSSVSWILIPEYHLLDSESRARALQTMVRLLSGRDGPMLILTISRLDQLPGDLLPYVSVLYSKKPEPAELQTRVEAALGKRKLPQSFRREIVSYLQGFQGYDVPYLFRRAELMYGEAAFDGEKKKILELIGREKVKLLEKEQLLEWKMVRQVDLANMDALKTHLRESGAIMSHMEEALEQGVDVPKGILILGLPGTGKSLFAQYAAAELKMPLIRLDMGRMMGGHVGDSERNLRTAQRQAEEMAPCILWIDEIEKGFAGSNGREEGAYLRRMTGSFLTWLQEKKSSCYIIATANSVEGLPSELFRKGRFDACFSTGMPTERELREILRVHLSTPARAHVKGAVENAVESVIRYAAAEQKFMTGADAGALVSNTFRRLFLDCDRGDRAGKQAYDVQHLSEVMVEEFKRMKVFSETNGADLARYAAALRESNFVDASDTGKPRPASRYDDRLKSFVERQKENLK